MWNDLPEKTKLASSLFGFKKRVAHLVDFFAYFYYFVIPLHSHFCIRLVFKLVY